MIKNTEYILMYYNETPPILHPLYEALYEYPVNYYQFIYKFPEENGGKGIYVNLVDVLFKNYTSLFHECCLSRKNSSVKVLFAKYPEIRRFIMANKERVVRKDSNVPRNIDLGLLENLEQNEYILYENGGVTYRIGINNSCKPYQLYSISPKVKNARKIGLNSNENEVLTNLLGDWWDGFYRDMSRVDKEGGVKMKTAKKPERLIEWILRATTDENDFVLDAFLGSGTTAAVALKMNRRFIGIEMGEQCVSLALPRLQKVVGGEDKSGISKTFGSHGVGGFKFFEEG
jgi:adenine specific DNA methylase Mod